MFGAEGWVELEVPDGEIALRAGELLGPFDERSFDVASNDGELVLELERRATVVVEVRGLPDRARVLVATRAGQRDVTDELDRPIPVPAEPVVLRAITADAVWHHVLSDEERRAGEVVLDLEGGQNWK